MNSVFLQDNQAIITIMACLAVLSSPTDKEELQRQLETALISKCLDTKQIIPQITSGIEVLDTALVSYSAEFESKVKGVQIDKISTGSEIFDDAFRSTVTRFLASNFPEKE
jgi:hypothetical protein